MESEIESENRNYIAMLEEVWKWFVDDVADTTDAVHKFQRDHCAWSSSTKHSSNEITESRTVV